MEPIGVDRMGAAADAISDPELLRMENLDTDIRPLVTALAATCEAVEDDDANSYLPFRGMSAYGVRPPLMFHVSRACSTTGARNV